MKIVLVIVLVIIAVYLYRRTQKAAEKELSVSKPEPSKSEPKHVSDVVDADSETEKTAIEDTRGELADSGSEPPVSEEIPSAEPAPASVKPAPVSEVTTSEVKAKPAANATPVEPNDTEKAAPKSNASTKPSTSVDRAADDPAPADKSPDASSGLAPIAPLSGNWASDTFTQLVDAYTEQTQPESQHKCLEEVIAHCYKLRKQTDYRAYGAKLSDNYLKLFEHLKADAKFKGELKGGAFMQLTTLLNDEEEFDAALKVCQQAIDYQLDDGTVTGYAGRLARVEKAKAKAQA
jgi:hypothetical protein